MPVLKNHDLTARGVRDSVLRFVKHQGMRHPSEPGAVKEAVLLHLARDLKLSASIQAQAPAALRFLYRHVVDRPLPLEASVPCGRRPVRLPEVLTQDEVGALLAELAGVARLVAALVSGRGMRLMECMTLRVRIWI